MVNSSQLSQGRNVYGSGSYAPTRGPVSAKGAQGYLQRELRRRNSVQGVSRFGGDGQSDTRSGNAQAALNRADQNRKIGQGNVNDSQRVNPNQGQQNQQGSPQPGPVPGNGAGGGASNNHVRINQNGTLDLPYNAAYSQRLLNHMNQYNSDVQALAQARSQELTDYTGQSRDLGIAYGQEQDNSVNQASGRGSLFSSAHVVDVANDANNFANTKADLDTSHTQARGDFRMQAANAKIALSQILQQEAMQRANQAAQDAGTLGYGRGGKKKRKDNARHANRNGKK